jgi:hypothetical protein
MGEEGEVYKILDRKPEGNRLSEDRGIDGRMRSEWILGRALQVWNGFSWLWIGTGGQIL